jgi:ABC-type transporter Mla subunit MlaD
MAKRKEEARVNFIVGIFVTAMGGVLLLSLFVIATRDGLLRPKATLYADFRTITGLADASKVQLAGHEIGEVTAVEFTVRSYECDPEHEDLGQVQSGRTDDCDPTLFCAATPQGGRCSELEPFAGPGTPYPACASDNDCAADTICITHGLLDRNRRMPWSGSEGVCVRYHTDHRRITVSMRVDAEKMVHIRTDSRASIASNGVLGDKLINITVGQDSPLADGGRVQTTPSLTEEIEGFKEQLYAITGKVETSLAGVNGLFAALNNDRTKEDLRGLLHNLNEVSGQVSEGKGLVGALISDKQTKEQFTQTLRHVENSAASLDSSLGLLRQDAPELLAQAKKTASSATALLDGVRDPNNKSVVGRLFHDEAMGQEVAQAVVNLSRSVAEVSASLAHAESVLAQVDKSVSEGTGTLGKMIKDPKAYDDLVKLFGNIERNNVVKRLVRYVISQEEAASSAGPAKRR